jgi:hypothetical protein
LGKENITFAGDTTGTIDNDNTAGLEISWWLVAGTILHLVLYKHLGIL